MNTYPKGQTIDLGPFELRNAAGDLVAATSTSCKVLKPDGTQSAVTLVSTSPGIFTAALTVDQAGIWTAEAKLNVGTQTAVLVESFRVNASPMDTAAAATTTYATPTLLRAELDVDLNELSDADATRAIMQAEDAIDDLLGGRMVDEATGRKVVEEDVEAWQWAKLQRATVLLAARFHNDPGLVSEREWRREKMGDVEREDPLGGRIPPSVLGLLDDCGLRRLYGRAVV